MEEHELKNCLRLFENADFFCILSCQNTANTSVSGLVCFENWAQKMKKTVVFAVHLRPLVEKTSHNTLFSTRSLKNSVNSDVFGDVRP